MNKTVPIRRSISKWLDEDNNLIQQLSELRTPAYIYSYANFKRRSDLLRNALTKVSPGASIFYSTKANPSRTMMKWTIEAGYRTEVSSEGELKHALKMGQAADRILLLGPGKDNETMEFALNSRVFGIVAESQRELDFLAAHHNGVTVIFIRVNIENTVPGVTESMVGSESKFGIDISELPVAFRKIEGLDAELKGIHYYMGSQLSDYTVMLEFHRRLLSSVSRFSDQFGHIDVGGGFAIPYTDNQSELDLDKFSAGLRSLMDEFSLSRKNLYFESGRYIAAEAGIFLTRVMDVKGSMGKRVIVTDGGMNNFMRIAFMKEHHPIEHVFPDRSASRNVKGIVSGPLCTPLDCFGIDIDLPEDTASGDIIGIFKAGAYGLTLSPVFFLLHNFPSEYAIRDGTVKEITRKDVSSEELFNSIY